MVNTRFSKPLLTLTILGIVALLFGCKEISRQPNGALYFAPSGYTGGFYGSMGDYSVQPTWHIAQWGIPEDLPSSGQAAPPGQGWYTANDHAQVLYDAAAGDTYELAQNGSVSGGLECGVEFDLFLEPNTDTYLGYPEGMVNSRPLDQLENLGFSLGLDITYEVLVPKCGLNYSAYVAAFIFTTQAAPQQTLFYQLIFRDSRNTMWDKAWCPAYEGSGFLNQFCVDDGLAIYGNDYLTVAESRELNFVDLLPRIKTIISQGHVKANAPWEPGLDTDVSKWRLTGLYLGQIVQGGMISTSRWDSFCLAEQEIGGDATNAGCMEPYL